MEHLIASAGDFGLPLTERQVEQFALYQALLVEWNKRINLTGAQTSREIQSRHFADSLSCSLVTGDLSFQKLIDVGSGAGFPGLPLKILYPDMTLTLLESVGKKGAFLREVIAELDLEDVSVITDRAESLAHEAAHREQYDWAVARAVAHISPLLEYLLPFCRLGGHALAQKGSSAGQELSDAQEALRLLGGELVVEAPVNVTDQADAYLIVVKKISKTPAKYPRRVGIPLKRPL